MSANEETFTVNMVRGAYVVFKDSRDRIRTAIDKGEPRVMIAADVLGDGLYLQPVELVTEKIISIVTNEAAADDRRRGLHSVK